MKISAWSTTFGIVTLVCACGGGTTGTGSDTKKGNDTGNESGSGSSSSGNGSSSSGNGSSNSGGRSSSSGKDTSAEGSSCGGASDCAYDHCRCNDGAIVNSRLCQQGTCRGPSAHCADACNQFGHGGWSGTTVAPPSDDSNSSNDPTPGGCSTSDDCPTFQCGCTNGSRIDVRDCYGGRCQDALSGCQSACSDSGRGDWDGT